MKALLKEPYLDEYRLRPLVRAVHNLFDDYNYKRLLSNNIYDEQLKRPLKFRPEDLSYHRKSDPTAKAIEVKDDVEEFISLFERKLSRLLEEFTDDEMIIYREVILNRMPDNIIRDRICKTDKTYYPIKKSCYLKIALAFELVDGYSKKVYMTISLTS